jgi:uncharacterized damage-inducible protein DinB
MKTIQKMFVHMNWANSRILEALKNNQLENLKTVQLFAHVLETERVWLTRLMGKDSSSLLIWSDADLDVCAQLVALNQESYAAYFANLSSAELDQFIQYRNQTGKEFNNSTRDILTHVALHGQYHRGQINALLRTEGLDPIDVDYITLARSIQN